MITIAVDCMGGDYGPAVTLPACAAFLASHPDAHLLLVGLPEAMAKLPASIDRARIQVIAASEVVTMDDPLEVALRRKRDSSMRVAINQVKDGAAQAAVSAGNTGALMAIARFVLKTLDGIDRPAIAGQMPNVTGGATTMLDLGANVDCSAEHLLQFAVMGSALVVAVSGKESPTVGLLNIGEEAIKGNEVIMQAGVLLGAAGLRPGLGGTEPVQDAGGRRMTQRRRNRHRKRRVGRRAFLIGLGGSVSAALTYYLLRSIPAGNNAEPAPSPQAAPNPALPRGERRAV